jgi:hypothetical protein
MDGKMANLPKPFVPPGRRCSWARTTAPGTAHFQSPKFLQVRAVESLVWYSWRHRCCCLPTPRIAGAAGPGWIVTVRIVAFLFNERFETSSGGYGHQYGEPAKAVRPAASQVQLGQDGSSRFSLQSILTSLGLRHRAAAMEAMMVRPPRRSAHLDRK